MNKTNLLIAALLTLAVTAPAQERLSRTETLRIAFLLAADLARLQATPIPTDVDLKRPVALREGDYGAMVLPESKLSADAIARATDQVLPVGQLWLHRLTPIRDGEGIWESELRMVSVETPDGSVTVPQCAMGVRRSSRGDLELLIFGRRAQPVLQVALKPIDKPSDAPIDMSAERGEDVGIITLRLLGKYEATFRVTEL